MWRFSFEILLTCCFCVRQEMLEILMVELFPEIRQLKEPIGRTPNGSKF